MPSSLCFHWLTLCLEQKQQIQILSTLVWPKWSSNSQTTTLKTSMKTSTPSNVIGWNVCHVCFPVPTATINEKKSQNENRRNRLISSIVVQYQMINTIRMKIYVRGKFLLNLHFTKMPKTSPSRTAFYLCVHPSWCHEWGRKAGVFIVSLDWWRCHMTIIIYLDWWRCHMTIIIYLH